MKPIHYIILGLAAALLLFAFLYNRKKTREIEAQKQNKLVQGALAIATITAVVDPTTGQEYIISNLGENNLDAGPDTRKMKQALATVINDINMRGGAFPGVAGGFFSPIKNLTLKMYDAKMNLVSSTTIANPYQQKLPIALPAVSQQNSNGINYSCAGVGNPTGPGFYNDSKGSMFFGMFCN